MTEQTERTEWRSGDVVVVTPHVADHWWVIDCADVGGMVPKKFFPDPQALAEFIDSQRPRPRFYVRTEAGKKSRLMERTAAGSKPLGYFYDANDAIRCAQLLNAQEATDG